MTAAPDSDALTHEVLHTLVEVSQMGECIFRACAEQARSADIRALMQRRANEYAQGTAELQLLALRHGLEPMSRDDMVAAMHQAWFSTRPPIDRQPDSELLAECDGGEDVALQLFAEAMGNALPSDIHDAVRRQIEGVTRYHDRTRPLRDESEPGG